MKNDTARYKAIEKLLAAKLRARAARGAARGENCPDSETLAAYVERSLARRERLVCETHLATCARCQEEVAELVRLGEADQPAVARPAAARAPGVALGITWFSWAWVAPALAAVVVAGLFWYNREPRGLRPSSAPASEEVAMKAPAPTQPVPPSPAPSAPPAVAGNKPVLPAPARPAALREAKEMAKVTSGTAPAARAALAKSVAIPATGRATTADNLVRPESAAPPVAPATPAGAPLGGTASGLIATPSERARLAPGVEGGGIAGTPSSESKEAEAAAAPTTAPAPSAVGVSVQAVTVKTDSAAKAKKQEPLDQKLARQKLARQKSARSDGSLTLEAFSTYARGNWRVGGHGLIEKPGPDGSWVVVPSGASADLNAIAFPTPSVGWVVGQSGIVLRSIDGGATWQKISFPTDEDLLRVSATSDRAARVTTSGGKIFFTADGGKSWKTS